MVRHHRLPASTTTRRINSSFAHNNSHTGFVIHTRTLVYPICMLVLVIQVAFILKISQPATPLPSLKENNRYRNPVLQQVTPAIVKDPPTLVIRQEPRQKLQQQDKRTLPPDDRPDSDLMANVKIRGLEEKLLQKFPTLTNVKCCKYHRRNPTTGLNRIVTDSECEQHTIEKKKYQVVFYNPFDHPRYLCNDVVVPANGFVMQPPDCTERPRLFPKTPILNNSGEKQQKELQPWIDVISAFPIMHDDFLDNDDRQERFEWAEQLVDPDRSAERPPTNYECNVPCRKTGADDGEKSIAGTNWSIKYSMESSVNYEELVFDQEAHKKDVYFATTSFDSEIPLPYFSWAEYSIQKAPAVDYDQAIKGASFIATNCESANQREDVVKGLMEIVRVDALGMCLHNAEPPMDMDNPERYSEKKLWQRQYLFHLAFENSNEKDYISEKLWGTLESGTVPVYMGAPNVKEHAPPNSIISYHDFESVEELGAYLKKVAGDKELYNSYHKWRKEPLPESFHKKLDFTHIHSICRICRWAYAKLYGYAFHHDTQAVTDTIIPRKLCWSSIDSDKLLTHPVRERWLQGGQVLKGGDKDNLGTCETGAVEFSTTVESWTRTVWTNDGVVDIEIESTGEDGVYQLEPLAPIIGAVLQNIGPRQWRLQNEKSRVTFVTSWDAKMVSLKDDVPGVVNIELRGQKYMRVRVIVEDLEVFYDDAESKENYFGDVMIKDLMHPLERFVVS